MIKDRSLSFKLILFFSASSTLIFLLIIFSNYSFSERMIMKNIRENAENLTLRTVNKIESALAPVKKVPENLAFFLRDSGLGREQLLSLLRSAALNNEELYGLGIAFEPFAFDSKALYFAPYYAKADKGLELTYMGDDGNNYFYDDWYQIPRELKRPVWSEPYFDDILMATYSVPFYKSVPEGGGLMGIICADISLENLTAIVSSVKVLKTGDAYLLSSNGTIITHSVKDLIMNETIFSVAEARQDKLLRQTARSMLRGESGFVPFVSIAREKKCWMYYAPVPSTGWTLAVIFPEDELFEDLRRHNLMMILLAACGILLLITVTAALAHSITAPLRRMSQAALAIGQGDLEVELPAVSSGDEVGKLTQAFVNMKEALKDYIRRLTATTAAKERIESELQIAREIQTGILPRIFPAFPERKEFEIYAMMEPAKEVGGDFYDFFLINERKLFFAMGDVSGKGVPAALFMMITKTLLKNEALQGASPAEILCKVNNILALDNNTSMFATVFCGILDTASGEVEFSNAGHNPALLRAGNGHFEFIKAEKGFVLGPMSGFKYQPGKITLGHNDCLFLYTDGVTEAMNNGKEFYSEAKLAEILKESETKKITDIVHDLRKSIKEFAGNEPQSDDITMLILKFS